MVMMLGCIRRAPSLLGSMLDRADGAPQDHARGFHRLSRRGGGGIRQGVGGAPQFPSAGYELDEGMHGPNFGYNHNHAVLVLNGGGRGADKALALARYRKDVYGNGYVIGEGAIDGRDLGFVPRGGPFACLKFAAAVQVFMYRLAMDGGATLPFVIRTPRCTAISMHTAARP